MKCSTFLMQTSGPCTYAVCGWRARSWGVCIPAWVVYMSGWRSRWTTVGVKHLQPVLPVSPGPVGRWECFEDGLPLPEAGMHSKLQCVVMNLYRGVNSLTWGQDDIMRDRWVFVLEICIRLVFYVWFIAHNVCFVIEWLFL